jgi:hypothetical protein
MVVLAVWQNRVRWESRKRRNKRLLCDQSLSIEQCQSPHIRYNFCQQRETWDDRSRSPFVGLEQTGMNPQPSESHACAEPNNTSTCIKAGCSLINAQNTNNSGCSTKWGWGKCATTNNNRYWQERLFLICPMYLKVEKWERNILSR